MTKKYKVTLPHYFKEFKCIGGKCEDSCCIGWDIDIDERTLGPRVKDYMTSTDGFFACGNIIYGEDALKISEIDGIECGEKAAEYIKKYFLK